MNQQTPNPVAENTPAPQKPGLKEKLRLGLRSKKMWGVAAVLLFLLGITGFVPVGKIPFLRNLAYMMGYSVEDTYKMSFLKALFSWNENAKMMRGEVPDPDALSVFGSGSGYLTSASAQAQNKLLDIRSVNAALAKQGRRADLLSGSYNAPQNSGETPDESTVRAPKTDASADTQANRAKTGEVYFGEDASLRQRDKNDAFDSSNTLKKVANTQIAGASSSGEDWFMRAVDRAVRSDSDLADLTKNMDRSGTAFSQLGAIGQLGNSRAKRDLYYAWLMGRAARRTQQVVLKKTLASAGFNGAEMPRTVFTASGFSGVAIKPDDILADMDNVQKYLDQDKNCQAAIQQGSEQTPTSAVVEQITGLASSFPATCGDRAGSTYPSSLQGISNNCKQMQKAYENVQKQCGTLSIALNDTQCHSDKLTLYYTEFDAFCKEKEEACAALEDADAQAECLAQAAQETSAQNYGEFGFNSNDLEGDVNTTFYDGENHFNTDYFPGVDWGRSLWLDGNVAR